MSFVPPKDAGGERSDELPEAARARPARSPSVESLSLTPH
jgi:hypothetical protein